MSLELKDVIAFIEPLIRIGVQVTINYCHQTDEIWIDLNTGAKSHCHLYFEGHTIIAYRRYDRVDLVESLDHLVKMVHECAHRRSFFDTYWLKVFEEFGLDDPRGVL